MKERRCCTQCDKTKELEKFDNLKFGKYGKHSWCKMCRASYRRANKKKIQKYKNTTKNIEKRIKKNLSFIERNIKRRGWSIIKSIASKEESAMWDLDLLNL